MKTLGHLNIMVSQMPIHILQSLQVGIFHEIRLCVDEANKEMTKVMDERAQIQQQYEIALQEKSEVAEKVEGVMKEKNEAEERVEKSLKEKDEVEKMAQKNKRLSKSCIRKFQKYH
jgi:hypothetical protein